MNGYQNPNYKTWDEWAKAAGVYDQFSAQQLAIAAEDPDYGWATTSNKVGYGAATTPEEQAKYHQQQVNLNMTKGFTGGTDGSLYDLSPTQQAQNSAKDAVMGYGPFDYSRAPDYKSVMDRVLNYGEFSYDPETDPVYSSYRKTYAREGRRASEDTMGQYAAMTGGRPSTAAMTAAQQAGNYYSAQMADKIPELYQQAYNRYLQEYQRQLQALGVLNTDRNFEYGVYGDRLGQLRDQYNLAAGENADALARVEKAEQTAYDRKISENKTAYQQALDEYARQQDEAKFKAGYGDYSGLDAMGVDTTNLRNSMYAYADDGSTYEIGSYKAQTFISSAAPGQTMQGGDGSLWRKNEDGTVSISKDGKTYIIGQAKAAEAPATHMAPVTPPDDGGDGGDGTPFPDVPKDAGIANRNDENGVYVRGKYYSWDDVWPLIQQGVLRYTYNQKNNRVTIDVPKEGEN